MSIDVNGNDNRPEWGWCKTEGCKEEAFPIWLSGDWPDEPDLLLCPKHIGLHIASLETQRKAWTELGAKAQESAERIEGAAVELLNQLALLTRDDESYLWRIGGRPLDEAYKALRRMLRKEST